jgi:hypothetical protein
VTAGAGGALRIYAESLRYNVKQARADLDRMQVRTRDQFYHQGYQTGRVAVMESVAESLEFLTDGAGTTAVVVDLDDWARAPELLEYARRRGVSIAAAVRELVNAGLTHQPEPIDPIALRARGVFAEVDSVRKAQRDAKNQDDDQAATDDRIARHEEFLASPGADHLFEGRGE